MATLIVVALAGCSGSAAALAPHPGPAAASPRSSPASAEPVATRTGPPEPKAKAGARAAAATFYRLYSGGRFAASWDLLTPTAQQAIPLATWVGVHKGCRSAIAGKSRVITSMLVFGSAAIVTERIAGAGSRPHKAHDVFSYLNGRWAFAPNDLSVYHHGSVAADIAAAKALGLCAGRESAPL